MDDKIRTRTKVLIRILAGSIILTTAFIWVNSTQNVPDSQADSLVVMEAIEPLLKLGSGEAKITVDHFRKIAHFAEFSLLGLELALLLVALRKASLQNVVNCLFASLTVAVIDETIQVFSNRGSQVTDVLLDFSGAATGIMVTLLAVLVARQIMQSRRAHD